MQHLPVFYGDSTFADNTSNLRLKLGRLKIKERRLTAAMVAKAFNGCGKYGCDAMRRNAQTAMRLPKKVIDTIRIIASREDPELLLSSDRLKRKEFSTVEENSHVVDCRTNTKFLNTSSLKASKALMNARDVRGELVQMNAIHPCASYILINNFKFIQHSVVTNMYKNSVYAFRKEIDFLLLTKLDDWQKE